MACRICGAETREVIDLGLSPPANALKRSPDDGEQTFPLVVEWCSKCHNVQLRDTMSAEELYRDYLYVTPQSETLAAHYDYLLGFLRQKGYIDSSAFVVEPGSNVGLFLRHMQPHVRQVLGVDPARAISQMANDAGIPTLTEFFSPPVAKQVKAEQGPADLVIARHCLAHNPSPHEMVEAARSLIADSGYFVIENAYVLNTVENVEFDQIYHEHMFYYSIHSMSALLQMHGFHLVDVTMSLVHGGSAVFVASPVSKTPQPSVEKYFARERLFFNSSVFDGFAERSKEARDALVALVRALTSEGASVHCYGATAKGNTLLSFAGLTRSDIPYCVDSTPMKQGLFLPGSGIKVIPERYEFDPPDYYLLTAWNYMDEIVRKVRMGGNYQSQFIVPIPFVRIV